MFLKDLRDVMGEQVVVRVDVMSGENEVSSGELWFFGVDDSINDLKVKDLKPKDDTIILTLECSPQEFTDIDWENAFNKKTIITDRSDSIDTIIEKGE